MRLLALSVVLLACSSEPVPEPRGETPPPPQQGSTGSEPTSILAAPVRLNRVAPEHLQIVQRSLAGRLRRTHDGLTLKQGPSALRHMSLAGRFQQVLIANQDEQGNSHVMCVDSEEGVAAALGHAATPP